MYFTFQRHVFINTHLNSPLPPSWKESYLEEIESHKDGYKVLLVFCYFKDMDIMKHWTKPSWLFSTDPIFDLWINSSSSIIVYVRFLALSFL